MATMQALLEKDKERFLNNMAAAKSSNEAVRTLEQQPQNHRRKRYMRCRRS